MKKLNVFRFFDWSILVSFVVFLFALLQKKHFIGVVSLIAFGGFIVLFGLFCLVQRYICHLTLSKIETKTPICVLDENSDEVTQNFIGERYDVDGIKTKKGVYKIVTGTHVFIDEHSNVKVKGFTSKIANRLGHGGILPNCPDDHWKGLFSCEVK